MPDSVSFPAFVFFFVVTVIGRTVADCPNLVPTSDDTAACAGVWYLSGMLEVGGTSPEIECLREINEVNSGGTINTTFNLTETQEDDSITFTAIRIPIDHVRSRLAYFSSVEPNNADIYIILKIEPGNYFITASCGNVEGKEEYRIHVLSVKNELDDNTMSAIKDFLTKANLSSDLKKINQANCSSA